MKMAAGAWGALLVLVAGAAWAGGGLPDLGSAMRHGATVDGIAAMIRQGVDVNQRDEEGFTPLMKAALMGRADLVPVLLRAGAKPEAIGRIDDMPVTAWDCAVVYAVISRDDAILAAVPAIATDGKPLGTDAAAARVQPAIEAFARRVIKGKLTLVSANMNTLTKGLMAYRAARGAYPGVADAAEETQSGNPVAPGSVWASLGFRKYPVLPPQVAAVHYIPFSVGRSGLAESFGLIYTLQGIKPRTVDGQLLGVSSAPRMVIAGPESARLRSGESDPGTARQFYYSCHQTTDSPLDPLAMQFFNNNGQPLVCQ